MLKEPGAKTQNILIIKATASGDVLRTTILLHILKGNIFWITARYNIPLFPDHYLNLTLIPAEDIPADLLKLHFDIIINLEEDIEIAKYLRVIKTNKTIGVFWNNGLLDYSENSGELFDMSLISKLSTDNANELKKKNKRSYQEIICGMVRKPFSGENYVLHRNNSSNITDHIRIGIEQRVGKRWPNKYWVGYGELQKELHTNNYEVIVFEQRDKLRTYMEEIRQCHLIIAGDTLAMHIALGYQIPCVGIFNCTSPAEIHDYGILRKIISPLLENVFYDTQYIKEATEAISVDTVLHAVYLQLQAETTLH